MVLLHWCTVSPAGQARLAAIRFTAPVRISSIRVFPNGAQPFANAPEIVAQTEPEAFYLEVFLNAQAISPTDLKESRAVNALVPTLLTYAGRPVDFTVDMGSEYATRLMIVKGEFEMLSMAIYGDVVTDTPPATEQRSSCSLPSVEPIPLPRAIDPSNASDPTLLAKHLLDLLPNSPPLPLVIRLMFCLKPPNDDWDLPEFPYLHADLDIQSEDELDLESVIRRLSKPVRDDMAHEDLLAFATKISVCITTPKDTDEAYQIAKLLSVSASQHPGLARALLTYVDFGVLFTTLTLDEGILLCLLDAATNVDIARHMNNDEFLTTLRDVHGSAIVERHTQLAANRLLTRITDWQCFEDTLSNTDSDFNQSWNMLEDVGTDEQSIGIWLESMILHEDINATLAAHPALASLQSHSPLHFRNKINITSHDAFVTVVRAYIGVACVLAVWAWADSLGNEHCRERALAILHLWQGVDGYSQIVNHLMLLRQFARRLEWISSDKDPPRQSGIHAEKIIFDLTKDPRALLNEDLVQTVLSLASPLSFIAEDELLSMREAAYISEDGLQAAAKQLVASSGHSASFKRLRTLRVSLAVIKRELGTTNGEWRTLRAFNLDEGSPGIMSCLIDILTGLSNDLNQQFALSPPPRMNQTLSDQLFLSADDLLKLIIQFTPAYPLTVRGMRCLIIALADIFACTDAADMMFSQSSCVSASARGTRDGCLELVRILSGTDIITEPGRFGAEVTLRTLFQHACHSGGRDPVYHQLQIFTLVDHILPDPSVEDGASHWVTSVLPNVLDELKIFLRLLDPEKKTHILQRLIKLDDETLGVGAWLLTEELKDITKTIETLASCSPREDYKMVLQYQVTLSLQFILGLAKPSSNSSEWCLNAMSSTPDLAISLTSCLMALLDGRYMSEHFKDLVLALATSAQTFEPELQFSLLLAALRVFNQMTQTDSLLSSISSILCGLTSSVIAPEPLRVELGQALSALSSQELSDANNESALSILEWLPAQIDTKMTSLCGITMDQLSTLFSALLASLPSNRHSAVEDLRPILTVDEDNYLQSPTITLPKTLELSIHDLDNLMRQDIPTPSTPLNGTKTPDILGLIISPPTAILRSQVPTTGLTKTYVNNDFRQLRQTPTARQNTSRLPSMHVDDFQENPIASAPIPGPDLELFPVLLNMDL